MAITTITIITITATMTIQADTDTDMDMLSRKRIRHRLSAHSRTIPMQGLPGDIASRPTRCCQWTTLYGSSANKLLIQWWSMPR